MSNGTWVDAGCGYGTYTFPLSTLASKVIALDVKPSNISYLKSRLSSETNIKALIKDFNHDSYASEPVDGVLFGFSLHYHPNPSLALKNAFNHLKSQGYLIIFEYQRIKPVPWVPYPLPLNKLLSLLESIGFFKVNVVFSTNRFYIVQGKKP
ncbi:MAG: class I SAM-dependent methyltransferase [Candidatus Hodarchaeota archaeon]